jgi:hypothetical protein
MAGQVQWRGPNIITEGLVFYMNSSSPSCYNTSSFISGGSTLKNISGFTSYSGSLTGTTVSTDSNYSGGNVFNFPLDTSGISLGDPTELRLGAGSFTISVWAKPNNTDNTGVFIQKRRGSGNFDAVAIEQGTLVATGGGGANINASKKISIAVRQNSTNQYYAYTTSDVIDGNWKHITFIRNSSTSTINIYINNINQSFTTIYTTNILANVDSTGNPWIIGNLSPTPTVGYNSSGPISSVQIYNRALSTDELTFNYNNSKALYGL